MGLDFIITKDLKPRQGFEERVFTFTDDEEGYYWFLYPLFKELKERTGLSIDLYEDACFQSESFIHLKTLIEKAREMVSVQPDNWDVCTGEQTFPEEKKLYAKLNKKRFNEILDKLDSMIRIAEEEKEQILVCGD
ncbi:MAG: hypothetical protein H6755_06335 [Candidatus Omnitrophica bacterium]|nr:hypothetical protein [Candidatus Omnitrophota bacterium]